MTRCTECGSTTTPIWESDDEWALVTVCMECVKKRHWSGIKFLSLVNTLGGLLFLLVNALPMAIIAGVVVIEMVILLAFCPYPLYGENRRRYKEWKREEKKK